MSSYDERPWLARYDAGQPSDIEVEFASALAMFGHCAGQDPDAPIIRYFDGALTRRELDTESSAFAAALAAAGFQAGERVALYLQNVPQFLVAMLGTWKAGGIAVAVNPMNKERELELILADSGAAVLVSHDDLYRDVAVRVAGRTQVRQGVTTSAPEYRSRRADRGLGGRPGGPGHPDGPVPRPAAAGPRAGPGRRGLPDLHLRHHRPPEGGHDHPPQHRVQRPDLPRLDRHRSQRRGPGRGPAVPHHRVDR